MNENQMTNLIIFLFLCVSLTAAQESFQINGDIAVSQTDDIWSCVNFDWWPESKCDYGTCSWGQSGLLNIDLSNSLLVDALSAFNGRVHLRVGGSLSDFVTYDINLAPGEQCLPFSAPTNSTVLGYAIAQGCLSMKRWDELNAFVASTAASMVFGVSALHGRQFPPQCPPDTNCREPAHRPSCCWAWTGPWSPDNFKSLLAYTIAQGYPVYAFEFGNELIGKFGIEAHFDATLYAEDFRVFSQLIRGMYASQSVLATPRTLVPGNSWDAAWFADFLQQLASSSSSASSMADDSSLPDIISHHLYSLGSGVDPHCGEHALDYRYLNRISELGNNVSKTVHSIIPTAPIIVAKQPQHSIWVGEGGGAYNSGSEGVTNTFHSGFWYLDEMASFARFGHGAYCRQTLVGGHYTMLDRDTFIPNPDYYSLLLWSRLMGTRVLSVQSDPNNNMPDVRVYAHCTAASYFAAPSGSITVLLINLSNSSSAAVDLNLSAKNSSMSTAGQHLYFMTSAGGPSIEEQLASHQVLLNGQLLQASVETGIPALEPLIVSGNSWQTINMAPLSYGFAVVLGANAPACL